MSFKQQIAYSQRQQRLYGQVTRTFVKQIVNKKQSLTDKIQLTKAALLSRNLRPYNLQHQQIKPKITLIQFKKSQIVNTGVSTFQNSFQIQCINKQCQTDIIGQKLDCYLKQSPQRNSIDTKNSIIYQSTIVSQNSNSRSQFKTGNQSDMFRSYMSLAEKDNDFDATKCTESQLTCTNWIGKNKFSSLTQSQCQNQFNIQLQQVQSLRNSVVQLKQKLDLAQQQIKKWKKKSMKKKQKLQLVQKQMVRFQKDYQQNGN